MNELIYKTEVESQMQKRNLWLLGDKARGGINWEIGTDIYTLLYIKQIINKDLLYSTGNSAQYPVYRGESIWEKNLKKKKSRYKYMYN